MMRIIVTLFCLTLCLNGLMAKNLVRRSGECGPSPNGEDYTCPQNEGMFPHNECNKFWQCSNCYAYAMPCAANLWWNDAKQECDYPEKVPSSDCIPPSGASTPAPTTTPAQEPTTSPAEETTTPEAPAEENTTQGSNDENTTQEPTTTQGSNEETTNPEAGAETTTQETPEETTTEANDETTTEENTTSGPTTTESDDSDEDSTECSLKPSCAPGTGMYHKHCDCTMFYQCSNGTPYEMDCAPGTVWNQNIKVCDWPNAPGTEPGCKPKRFH